MCRPDQLLLPGHPSFFPQLQQNWALVELAFPHSGQATVLLEVVLLISSLATSKPFCISSKATVMASSIFFRTSARDSSQGISAFSFLPLGVRTPHLGQKSASSASSALHFSQDPIYIALLANLPQHIAVIPEYVLGSFSLHIVALGMLCSSELVEEKCDQHLSRVATDVYSDYLHVGPLGEKGVVHRDVNGDQIILH